MKYTESHPSFHPDDRRSLGFAVQASGVDFKFSYPDGFSKSVFLSYDDARRMAEDILQAVPETRFYVRQEPISIPGAERWVVRERSTCEWYGTFRTYELAAEYAARLEKEHADA